MKLVIRDPRFGYLDRWLWLPKREVSEAQIASSLSYKQGDKVIKAWRETPYHFLVPRNFWPAEGFASFRFPVIDSRFKDFPRVDIHSRVVPDRQRPDLTYQRDSVRALQSTYDGILCLRCGGGKSPTGLHAAAALKTPILIVVDEKALQKQWQKEILQFLDLPNKTVGMVGDGKFDWKHDVTVASVQTLASYVRRGQLPPAMTRWFGVILLDEVHVMGAPYFNSAIPEFHGRRWGLSATPQRDDPFDSLLRYTCGRVVFTYLMPETRPNVYFCRLPTVVPSSAKKQVADSFGKFHFRRAYSYLATLPSRLKLIANEIRLAVKKGRKPLILTHSVKMCDLLYAELKDDMPSLGMVYGKIQGKKRLEIIKNSMPLIAIMRIGEKALDKPELDTLFVCEPYTKPKIIQQTFGRLLRLLEGKPSPVVIIFEDVHIDQINGLCGSMRRELARWPEDQGGAIGFGFLTPGHHLKKETSQHEPARKSVRRPSLREGFKARYF